MPARTVILDCDPGVDDAVAILLALASPEEIELLAITTVAGNVPLAHTARNARRVVELAGRTVPVFAGCPRPILEPLRTAPEVHGESGLGGIELPEPHLPLAPRHAVEAIRDLVLARPPGTVTLCATGPLTNPALALVMEPALAGRLTEIVLMGGARDLGNVTAAAEFNIYVDPHAARVVFESGVPITMIGLDLTHRVLVGAERAERIRALGTPVAAAVHAWLSAYDRHGVERRGWPGPPLHDACAVARLVRPSLFAGRRCRVDVETEGVFCRGRTVVDWWDVSGRPANALVLTEADADGFFDLLIERLARL